MFQDEYVKAYYAALFKKQQELQEAAKTQQETSKTPPISDDGLSGNYANRQVGMKAKREEDEGDDDVDWEEAPVSGNTNEFKVNDLNVEAEASGEEEDDIDWEEG
ncbi:hypothetical protein Pint_16404 [Pistacia integerrima]|uniref:Uncharacterized protein n=2 Tax=Pistacia TaxID=55512 RepID=A0ACC1C3X1_9ROSI|nr:hypothetical protein Pint_16404 [Pistacia integerrima]KAJ0106728.1 hypothetical protein Patl1_19050 [Pistacia atlantica]